MLHISQCQMSMLTKNQSSGSFLSCSKGVFITYSRLHGRYHELAPHLVPMDYTNDPDCKLPLALIVNMPELKVNNLDDITSILIFYCLII